ncbi:MAG: hypothetical protein HY394_00700 [Candidatus Diapherotrites archaeon]|nr:hypothetical protein [Candidatus Diapherotrites archaeon]
MREPAEHGARRKQRRIRLDFANAGKLAEFYAGRGNLSEELDRVGRLLPDDLKRHVPNFILFPRPVCRLAIAMRSNAAYVPLLKVGVYVWHKPSGRMFLIRLPDDRHENPLVSSVSGVREMKLAMESGYVSVE